MMLSRVADNLYWLSRYLERAEHTARVVDVTLDLKPDRSAGAATLAWSRLFDGLRLPSPNIELNDTYALVDHLTFEPEQNTSIVSYIAAARENARHVREQLSSETWEQINRLYLDVKNTSIDQIWSQPHEFFQMVKQGAYLCQGISDSTMNHGEGWHFLKLGQYIERAGNTAALLNVNLRDAPGDQQQALSTDQYLDWVSLLRSCTALESYCKVYSADTRFDWIAEFLLLNAEFPHSVHFSVKLMQAALSAITEATDTRKNSQVYRQVGRLKATLDFDQIDEVIAEDLHAYLGSILQQCAQIHTSIYETYVEYPISKKLAPV